MIYIYIFDGLFSELGMESKIDRLGFAEIGEKNQKNQSKTLGEKQNEEKRTETTNNVGVVSNLQLVSLCKIFHFCEKFKVNGHSL